VTRNVAVSLDQLYRPQPGGIATYVRGLINGLNDVEEEDLRLIGFAPRGEPNQSVEDLKLFRTTSIANVKLLTEIWRWYPLGAPTLADVVHATSLAGPFGGGKRKGVRSLAIHDLLWRDEPAASTARGIAFHESRLKLLKRHYDIRIITTAPGLADRLEADGIPRERLFESRLGVGSHESEATQDEVRSALLVAGVTGPFTLYAGTREPRKNLPRLMAAHARARSKNSQLGPLVFVGPSGWGSESHSDAVVLGTVTRSLLLGLFRDAAVVSYVPLAEGFGLPPIEALYAGTRVVASSTTPSVAFNDEVIRVDPLDEESIEDGLLRVLDLDVGAEGQRRRKESVADFTWKNVALDHLAAWR
jgi:glycosyltransferase involved in cell wall biosynthesis